MIGARLALPRSLAIGGALVGAAIWVAAAAAGESIAAEDAWVPWAPAVVKVHAGYMTIVNRSAAQQSIVGANSPDYERVEMHGSSVKDGMSTMRALDQVTVPANGRVAFAPTGLHFMLIGPKRPPAVDSRVNIVLRLASGERIGVVAVVRKRGGGSQGGHAHHGGAR